MGIKHFLKPSWLKIILTLIFPLTIWYGTVYEFDYSAQGQVGKPNLVYQSFRMHHYPQIVTIPFSILNWFQSAERVTRDNYVFTDIVTFTISLAVNYLIVSLLIFLYKKTKH